MASSFGIKVSKEGYNVMDQLPGSLNLYFDTNSNSLKEKLTGTASGGAAINHGMGTIPIFMVYDSDSLSGKRRISTKQTSFTGQGAYATSTQVHVDNGQYVTSHYFVFFNS